MTVTVSDTDLKEIKRCAEVVPSLPWKLDLRNGCLAIYPANEDHNCLSGASEWAIHFAMGYEVSNKDGKFVSWRVDQEKIDVAAYIVAACNSVPALIAELEMARERAEVSAQKQHGEDWLIGQLRASLDREERLLRAIMKYKDLLSIAAGEEEANPLVARCRRVVALHGLNEAVEQWIVDVREACGQERVI